MAKKFSNAERLIVFKEISGWIQASNQLVWIITSASVAANFQMFIHRDIFFANRRWLIFAPIILDIVVFLLVESIIMISSEVGKLVEDGKRLTRKEFGMAAKFYFNLWHDLKKWKEAILNSPWGWLNLMVTVFLLLLWGSLFFN